jgi:hypothetical protein
MLPTPTLARRFWEAIEPIHALVYFADEPVELSRALGLPGWWMGYFSARVAPLGPLGPAAAGALCYSFAPGRVARALPDAWSYATPEAVLATRLKAAQAALERAMPPVAQADLDRLTALLERAVDACRYDGRALAAGWSRVDRPTDPVGRLWLAATVLREHRGDGHVIAAVHAGLRGIDAALTHVATGAITREMLQPNRGWTDDEWEGSRRRLVAHGVLDRTARLTKHGGALRRQIEDATDRLAAEPVIALGPLGVEEAIELATDISRHLVDTGAVPVPNPIGAPRP